MHEGHLGAWFCSCLTLLVTLVTAANLVGLELDTGACIFNQLPVVSVVCQILRTGGAEGLQRESSPPQRQGGSRDSAQHDSSALQCPAPMLPPGVTVFD
jgi:hypothetical protein